MASLGNRMKVVVVDDSAAMRAVLRAILKSDGHEVVGKASNGMSAVTMVSHLKPDIVTLDLVMPGLSGLETLSEILRTGSDTHVLIVSATNDRQPSSRLSTSAPLATLPSPSIRTVSCGCSTNYQDRTSRLLQSPLPLAACIYPRSVASSWTTIVPFGRCSGAFWVELAFPLLPRLETEWMDLKPSSANFPTLSASMSICLKSTA